MTKQYEFNGTQDEINIFRTECSRLRIKTLLRGEKENMSVLAFELTEKQHQSVKNLATAITAE